MPAVPEAATPKPELKLIAAIVLFVLLAGYFLVTLGQRGAAPISIPINQSSEEPTAVPVIDSSIVEDGTVIPVLNSDTGEVSSEIPNIFPLDFPLFNTGALEQNYIVRSGGRQQSTVSYLAQGSVADIYEKYIDYLELNIWGMTNTNAGDELSSVYSIRGSIDSNIVVSKVDDQPDTVRVNISFIE